MKGPPQRTANSPSQSHNDIANTRRLLLQQVSFIFIGTGLTLHPSISQASEIPIFTRQSDRFGYTFQPPVALSEGNKPLKTHLDEVNFFGSNGYQIGITIDPVRIDTLAQFGTPAEVAAKVVLAEVNRDGVFDVTLMQDPVAKQSNDSVEFYQLDYLSKGKRGDKRFICKFVIYHNMLYALTAQCKQEDYDFLNGELLKAVDSFQVIVWGSSTKTTPNRC